MIATYENGKKGLVPDSKLEGVFLELPENGERTFEALGMTLTVSVFGEAATVSLERIDGHSVSYWKKYPKNGGPTFEENGFKFKQHVSFGQETIFWPPDLKTWKEMFSSRLQVVFREEWAWI